MSARDKLAEIINEYMEVDIPESVPDKHIPTGADYGLADEIIEAGWRPPMRVISTVEELEALPDRAIIFDKNGDVYERRKNEWENIYLSPIYADEDSPAGIHPRGPFRVVWEPEQ